MFSFRLRDDAELRILELNHAAELFELADRNRERIRPFLPWIDATSSVDDVRRFIRKSARQFAANRGFHAGIFVNGTIAGAIGMHEVDWDHRHCSIGYWIGGEYEGRGLVSAAVRAVVSHCFDALALRRIEIRCATDNVRSCAIPEKLGFQLEGVLRSAQRAGGRWLDIKVYGKLDTDPR